MNFNIYITGIQTLTAGMAKIEVAEKIFEVSGCESSPSESMIEKWLYGENKEPVSIATKTYFSKIVNGKTYVDIERQKLFEFFREKSEPDLRKLQEIFRKENDKENDKESAIDTKTKNMDDFCWSLVRQFLRFLHLPEESARGSAILDKGNPIDKVKNISTISDSPFIDAEERCCFYCSNWSGKPRDERAICRIYKDFVPIGGDASSCGHYSPDFARLSHYCTKESALTKALRYNGKYDLLSPFLRNKNSNK